MLKDKLKLALTVFIVVGSCFFILYTGLRREIKNTDSGGKNIICFGDSITFGYGVNPGEDYPSSLQKLMSRPVINAGVDGNTSALGLARLRADVLARDPYLVLIEFSGNDFINKIPVSSTINNIKEMIRQIQHQGAMVAIVDVSAGLFLGEYRLKLFQLARQTGSIFIPATLSNIITNPSLKSDFMHPNVQGYKIISQRVYQAIVPYLKEPENKK